MSNTLTINSAFAKRFLAWANDRFPLPNILSGALSYTTMVTIGKYIANTSLSLTLLDLLGAFAFIGHLFLLRVFDEHKDYEVDKVNHPNRALSKGLITLKHLKILAIPMPFIALYWSILSDHGIGVVTTLWLIMFIYSLLMAKEFFIGGWLSKRLVLYSFSHMIVSPMMILWIIIGGSGAFIINSIVCTMLVLGFTGGIAYEITRKTRGADEDINLDAYNKYFGINGCLIIISIMNLISFGGALNLLMTLKFEVSTIAYILLVLGYLCTFYPTINFLKKQTEKARKINEAGIGLFFLGLYFSIICAFFI